MTRRLLPLIVALTMLAVACGGDDDDSSSGSETESTTDTAASADAEAPTGEPIKIGSVVTDDGLISFGAAADTLEAWTEWVNDTGGIGGRPVEIEVLDDQLNPDRAREVFGQLTSDDDLLAIVGAFAPLGIAAALPDIAAENIPLVPGSGLVIDEFDSPTAYMLSDVPETFGEGACLEATRRGWDKAALIYLDSAEVAPIIDGYEECAEAEGGEVVLNEAVSLGAASMADVALRIIDAEPDVIFLEIPDFIVAQLWAELDLQGAQIPSLGNPGIYGDVLRDYTGPAAEGFVMQTGILPPHSDDRAVEAVREVVEQYRPGTELIPVAMNAWAGAELFRLAAEAVLDAGEELTRESLLAALDEVTGFDAGGLIPPIDYGPDDHIGSDGYWFFELEDGEWGQVGDLQEP